MAGAKEIEKFVRDQMMFKGIDLLGSYDLCSYKSFNEWYLYSEYGSFLYIPYKIYLLWIDTYGLHVFK